MQEKEIILKYCHLINIFGFNIINIILIDRVKGAHVLMNCVLKYCKKLQVQDGVEAEAKAKSGTRYKEYEFLSHVLFTVAVCLRLQRSVIPFLKDSKDYLNNILSFMRSQIKNKELTINGLTIIKLLLSSEASTQLALSQYQSLAILLLQIIDFNQQNGKIVRYCITCLQSLLSAGKAMAPAQKRKLLVEILEKP